LKSLLSKAIGWNGFQIGMEHLWDKGIQLCTNKIPGVLNGPAPGEDSLIYIYGKKLRNTSHSPLGHKMAQPPESYRKR